MFRTRPPWFAVSCVALWLLQLGLAAAALGHMGTITPAAQRWCELAALAASASLGAMLLVQLPRALQWRPRLTTRPSAEVLAERRRIARDLHDHLGAQLVCALVMLEPSRDHQRALHAALEKCLLDLRLIVDSMDGAQAPFPDRLAQLRYRMEPVLAQRGIRMKWDVQIAHCTKLPQRDSCAHLVAIVQEALSNALQHAGANEVAVSVREPMGAAGALCVEIRDNGCGVESQSSGQTTATRGATGSGMAGMAHRAQLAGAELSVSANAGGGTCVRVTVPCAGAQASSAGH